MVKKGDHGECAYSVKIQEGIGLKRAERLISWTEDAAMCLEE